MKRLGAYSFVFLLGAAACFISMRSCKHKNAEHAAKVAERKTVNEMGAIKDHMNDTVTHYRDMYNQEHAQRELIQGNAEEIKIFYKKHEDSICKLLHLRNAQLKDMTEVVSHVSGTFSTKTQMVGEQDGPGEGAQDDDLVQGMNGKIPDDSTGANWKGFVFTYKDDFISEQGFVDSMRTVVYYDIYVPVGITSYWKRKWLLGKKRYFIDGYSANPNVHITGLEGISINH